MEPVPRDESPPLRSTLLGSFLRGRPRGTSISVANALDVRDLSPPAAPAAHHSHQHQLQLQHHQLSPPSPAGHRRWPAVPSSVHPSPAHNPAPATAPSAPVYTTPLANGAPFVSNASVPASSSNTTMQQQSQQQPQQSTSGPSLGLTSMLRRRRSAGTLPNASNGATAGNHNNHSPSPNSTAPPATTTNTYLAPPAPALGASRTPSATAPASAVPGGPHRIRLVPHLDTRRSLRFEPIARDLRDVDPPLRIGRFTDRSGLGLSATNALGSHKLAFKSKVVSRAHAEIWVDVDGRFFVKDTKSSSGTFLNHVRLSPAGAESKGFQLKDGDIVQLGVDYQGGAEDIYKSVKIRIEIGREWQSGANAFNTNAIKQLRSLAASAGGPIVDGTANGKSVPKANIPDCCICLFAVTIRQALFIAPCSHTFHYKCIRPLLDAHHPAFSCPLCRSFADLEEDVEVDVLDEDDDDDVAAAVALMEAEEAEEREREESGGLRSGQMQAAQAYQQTQANGYSYTHTHSRAPVHRDNGAETEVEPDMLAPSGATSRFGALLRRIPGAGARPPRHPELAEEEDDTAPATAGARADEDMYDAFAYVGAFGEGAALHEFGGGGAREDVPMGAPDAPTLAGAQHAHGPYPGHAGAGGHAQSTPFLAVHPPPPHGFAHTRSASASPAPPPGSASASAGHGASSAAAGGPSARGRAPPPPGMEYFSDGDGSGSGGNSEEGGVVVGSESPDAGGTGGMGVGAGEKRKR